MTTAGPQYPSTTTVVSIGGKGAPWSGTSSNLFHDDGLYLSSTPSLQATNYLKGTGYGFAIPVGATINGILLEINAQAFFGSIAESSIKLVQGGTIMGSDLSTGASLSNTLTRMSYGGASELWGLAWLPSIINSSTFGAVGSWVTGSSSAGIKIDSYRITVTYGLAGAGGARMKTVV